MSVQIRIREWCLSEGHQILHEEPAPTVEDPWTLVIGYEPEQADENEERLSVYIIGHDKTERLSIVLSANLDAKSKAIINGDNSGTILTEFDKAVLRTGARLVWGKTRKKITNVTFYDVIYYDAPLTRHLVMNRLETLYSTLLFSSHLFGVVQVQPAPVPKTPLARPRPGRTRA